MTKKISPVGQFLVLALFLANSAGPVPGIATVLTQGKSAVASTVQDDPDFAAFVKKATTKPEFLSPLVDHLPKKAGVPSPKDVLGYHIGTEKKLTYAADQQRYFRALEKALPARVKTEVTGKTEEGRDIMVIYISSEANMKNLEMNRQNMKKLADPRAVRLSLTSFSMRPRSSLPATPRIASARALTDTTRSKLVKSAFGTPSAIIKPASMSWLA